MKPSEKIETGYANNTDEIRRMILENPDLPILALAGEDAGCADYRWTTCTCVYIKKGEFLDCEQEIDDCRVYTDRRDFAEDLEEHLYNELDINGEELDELVKQELAEYEPYWKPCLLLYVDN